MRIRLALAASLATALAGCSSPAETPAGAGRAAGRGRAPVPARARRRRGRRAALRRRLHGAAAATRRRLDLPPVRRRPSPAATSTTTSATRTASRCAACSSRSSTHAAGIDPATLAEITRYTKLFWLNIGPYNNLTARKFVLTCTPEAFAAAARGRDERRHASPPAPASRSTSCWRGCVRCSSTPTVDPMVTNKTPEGRQGHPAGERQQPLQRRRRWPTSRASPRSTASTRGSSSRTAGWSKRSTRSAAATTSQIRAIVGHLEAAQPFATPTDGGGAARARAVVPHRRGRRPQGLRHRLGATTRRRRSTRSTASSRSTSTPAASRARGKRSSST